MNNDNQKAHFDYIKAKGKFIIACNRVIFTSEQIELLEKYGHWFEALTNRTLSPINETQRLFIEVARLHENHQTNMSAHGLCM